MAREKLLGQRNRRMRSPRETAARKWRERDKLDLPTCLAAAAGKVRPLSLLMRQCLFAGPGSVGRAMLLGCAKPGLSLTPWTPPELPYGCVSSPACWSSGPAQPSFAPSSTRLTAGGRASRGKEGQVKPGEYLPRAGRSRTSVRLH